MLKLHVGILDFFLTDCSSVLWEAQRGGSFGLGPAPSELNRMVLVGQILEQLILSSGLHFSETTRLYTNKIRITINYKLEEKSKDEDKNLTNWF